MVFDLPVVDFLFAFLFIVPGYFTLVAYEVFGKVDWDLETFDKTVLSLVFSGHALALTWLIVAMVWEYPHTAIITGELSFIEWGLFYLGTLLLASLAGILFGLYTDHVSRGGEDTRRERVWTLTFRNASQPVEVKVVTKKGDVIHGYAYAWDSVYDGRDLLVRWPTRLKDVNGVVDTDGEAVGQSVMIDESDISHIYFLDDVDIDYEPTDLVYRLFWRIKSFIEPRSNDGDFDDDDSEPRDGDATGEREERDGGDGEEPAVATETTRN